MVLTVGPDWTARWTAFGTVGAAVMAALAVGAAVAIALVSERRADARVAAERAHSDERLRGERERGDARLAEERRVAREREQLGEAYSVQVVTGEAATGEPDVTTVAVFIVNRGRYTITQVEAQFCLGGGTMITHHAQRREPGPLAVLPAGLRLNWGTPERDTAMMNVLTPWDEGMRFASDGIHARHLASWYPVVRWTDRWGTRWEHKRGEVRPVKPGAAWRP